MITKNKYNNSILYGTQKDCIDFINNNYKIAKSKILKAIKQAKENRQLYETIQVDSTKEIIIVFNNKRISYFAVNEFLPF